MVKIVENPIKMGDLGGENPLFSETSNIYKQCMSIHGIEVWHVYIYIYCIRNTFTFVQPGSKGICGIWVPIHGIWAEEKSSGAVACQVRNFRNTWWHHSFILRKIWTTKSGYERYFCPILSCSLKNTSCSKKIFPERKKMEYHTPDDWKFKLESTNPFLFSKPEVYYWCGAEKWTQNF